MIYPPDHSLGKVLRDQLGHLEHAYGLLAAEHLLEVGIGVDIPPVLGVLEAVFLDVFPQFLNDFRPGQRTLAYDCLKLRRELHWLHERGICHAFIFVLFCLFWGRYDYTTNPLVGYSEFMEQAFEWGPTPEARETAKREAIAQERVNAVLEVPDKYPEESAEEQLVRMMDVIQGKLHAVSNTEKEPDTRLGGAWDTD